MGDCRIPMIVFVYGNTLCTIFGGFWGIFNASVTQIWFKGCFHIQKRSLECDSQLTLSSIWSKNHYSCSKTTLTDYIVEKTNHFSRYIGPFRAYFMPQGPKKG